MADVLSEDDIEVGKLEDVKVELEVTEEEDERISADSDDDRDAIRARRRNEKVERKDRRDKAITRDRVEMDFLRNRNDDLERRLSNQEVRAHHSDVAVIDQRLQEALQEAQMAEQVIAKAVTAGNGDDVTQAMRYRDQAIARANEINNYKQQFANAPVVTPKAERGIDSESMSHAQEFIQDNPWYNPSGQGEDSAIVLAIDNALVGEGFDSRSEEYWDELRDRVKRRLPEKFGDTRHPRGGPAVGSGREHAPASTRREVYISPERKQALVDAGVWDDPVLRTKYVKKYMEYDRANRA
jgi:hypothetical protein